MKYNKEMLVQIQWTDTRITELKMLREMLVDVFEEGCIDADVFNHNMFESDLLLEALYKRLEELENNIKG
jgi:hypothetical protein